MKHPIMTFLLSTIMPVSFLLDPSVFLRTFFSNTFMNKSNAVCTADDGSRSELSLGRKIQLCHFHGMDVSPYTLH